MCRTESAAREALRRIGWVIYRPGLTPHRAKARLVDLRRGKESFKFLGCTIRKKRSIQRKPRWHFMQRWPSPKAMKKLRERVRELTSKRQSGKDVKRIIVELTPVLRGWGNYSGRGMPTVSSPRWIPSWLSACIAGSIGEADNAPRSAHLLPANSFTGWACFS